MHFEHDVHNLRLGSGGACGACDPVMELSWQQRDSLLA